MTAKVLNVFANLETEFLEAKQSLKDVDDSIKKMTGREPRLEPSVVPNKERSVKPTLNSVRNRVNAPFGNTFSSAISQIEEQSEEPQRKRRFHGSAFSRLRFDQREMGADFDEPIRKPTVQSSVIATTREVKPRTQALEEQKNDKKSLARNKRMFGMILGTLQKFQNEETTRKDTQTQKRVEIEKKLDAKAEEERNALRKEKRELFLKRREKQAQIRRIEHKMQRVEIHQEWERSHQHLSHFIQTKTKPHIFYLPAKHTPESEKRLQETKDKYRLIVAEKRAKVQKELSEIDELYKKEEQNEAIDEEMDEIDIQVSNEKEISDEIKTEDQIKNELILESNNRVISGENISQNQISNNQINIVIIKSEDTSNGLNTEMEMESQEEQIIGDKEFEPIYDP